MLFAGTLLAAFVASPNDASACRCRIKGPFLANAAEAEIVIRATIVTNAYAPIPEGEEIEVTIDEVMKGHVTEGRVKLAAPMGNDCPPEPSALASGTSWVIVLERSHRADGYVVRSCGINWVRVRGDRVEGKITDRDPEESMSLGELRTWIKQRHKP